MPWSAQFAAAFHPVAERHAGRFPRRLAERLARLSARTLVADLHAEAAAGRLLGDTPAERFTDHARRLADGRLADVLSEYPALSALVDRVAANTGAAHAEALDRLAADRTEVVARLLDGRDPGPVRDLRPAGDTHCRGRAVTVVTFADGRVVYKPRPVDVYAHLDALVARLAGPRLRTLDVVVRPGYGWVRHLAAAPCRTPADLHRFYHRQGRLLALLHLLNGTDVHYENLIAVGEHPVLVDLETLFHPTLPLPAAGGVDPAAAFLADSVFRSALLPVVLIGDAGSGDVSGLGGERGVPLPTSRADWADPGTDRMRLVRHPARTVGASNRPGRTTEPRDFRADLLAGFRAAYDAVLRDRDALAGPLAAFADDEVRVVTRPTWLYSALLDESTHPDLLRSPVDREAFLMALDDVPAHPAVRRLTQWEVADLMVGDVPLFRTTVGGRELRTADGTVLPDVLPCSGADAVARKLAAASELDRQRQEWVIAAALATRAGAPVHRVATGSPGRPGAAAPDVGRLVATASGIADEILARAHRHGGRVYWLGLEPVEDRHWSLLPMGAGLPYGYLGVALFLATVGGLTGARRHLDLAADVVAPLPAVVDAVAADPEAAEVVGPGFAGVGGICHAAVRLGRLVPGGTLDVGLTLLETLTGSSPPGYADGAAGAVAALLSVREAGGDRAGRAGELADRYADRLLDAVADGTVDALGPGFLHGRAGVAWALLRHGGPRQRAAALHLLDGLPATADPGWCSGRAGTAVALVAAGRADDAAPDARPLDDLSLCHGELGRAEPLHLLARRGGPAADRARAALSRRAALVLGALQDGRPRAAAPDDLPNAALLIGSAGIGYGLLRLADPGVPSVLLMEPADRAHGESKEPTRGDRHHEQPT
jgi:type 2 lantibiotic biosynthesis protein LanM